MKSARLLGWGKPSTSSQPFVSLRLIRTHTCLWKQQTWVLEPILSAPWVRRTLFKLSWL